MVSVTSPSAATVALPVIFVLFDELAGKLSSVTFSAVKVRAVPSFDVAYITSTTSPAVLFGITILLAPAIHILQSLLSPNRRLPDEAATTVNRSPPMHSSSFPPAKAGALSRAFR